MTCGGILQVEQHETIENQRLSLLNWEGITPHFEIIVNTSVN